MPEAPADHPRTRAELLLRQRAEIARLTKQRWAVRRLVLPAAVSFALTFVVFLGAEAPEGQSSVGRAVALAAILGLWAWVQWRHVRISRRIEARRREWTEADRTPGARSLPSGDLDPKVATIWDVRDSADLEQVSSNVGFSRQAEIFGAPPVFSMVVGAFTGLLASIAVLDAVAIHPIVGGDRVIAAVAFGAIALSGWVLAWTSGREYWRRQRAWNLVGLERQVYLERRRALGGPAPQPDPQLPPWARPLAASVVVILLAMVAVRVASASAVVLLAAGGILLAAGLLIALAVVRAQRLHVVPLRSGGADVLSSPACFVRVELGEAAFTIVDVSGRAEPVSVDVERVKHVTPLPATYRWVPPPLLVITDDHEIVLAGRGTGPLRRRLEQRKQSRRQES
jgi:hypothetical protein